MEDMKPLAVKFASLYLMQFCETFDGLRAGDSAAAMLAALVENTASCDDAYLFLDRSAGYFQNESPVAEDAALYRARSGLSDAGISEALDAMEYYHSVRPELAERLHSCRNAGFLDDTALEEALRHIPPLPFDEAEECY